MGAFESGGFVGTGLVARVGGAESAAPAGFVQACRYFDRVDYRTFRDLISVTGNPNKNFVQSETIRNAKYWYVLYAAAYVIQGVSGALSIAFFLVPERDRFVPAAVGNGIILAEQKTGVLLAPLFGQSVGGAGGNQGGTQQSDAGVVCMSPLIIPNGFFLRAQIMNPTAGVATPVPMELRMALIELGLDEEPPI